MKAIANETEAEVEAANHAVDNAYGLVTITGAPRTVDRAGHYIGGKETIKIPRMWRPVAKKLVAAGGRRAFWSHARDDAGLDRLYETWDEIREIWNGPAYEAGIPVSTAAALVGVSRAAMYNIIHNKRGKRPSAPAPEAAEQVD